MWALLWSCTLSNMVCNEVQIIYSLCGNIRLVSIKWSPFLVLTCVNMQCRSMVSKAIQVGHRCLVHCVYVSYFFSSFGEGIRGPMYNINFENYIHLFVPKAYHKAFFSMHCFVSQSPIYVGSISGIVVLHFNSLGPLGPILGESWVENQNRTSYTIDSCDVTNWMGEIWWTGFGGNLVNGSPSAIIHWESFFNLVSQLLMGIHCQQSFFKSILDALYTFSLINLEAPHYIFLPILHSMWSFLLRFLLTFLGFADLHSFLFLTCVNM